LDQFCADGHAEDALPVHFKDHGVEISGYGVSSDDRCLDLFLTTYSPRADDDHKVDRGAIEAGFKRVENFLSRCLAGQIDRRDLAELYSAHGARLLELNVRSFLQIRGGVNRGIFETLRANPERFLAYNNGIAATASKVDFEETPSGQRLIRRIHNLQIVNGGQT